MSSFSSFRKAALSRGWRALHWTIIGNYAANIGYAFYETMVVHRPEGVKPGMPLGKAATDIDQAMMDARRGYAAEAWLSIAGLSTYLAITEVAPRLAREALREVSR